MNGLYFTERFHGFMGFNLSVEIIQILIGSHSFAAQIFIILLMFVNAFIYSTYAHLHHLQLALLKLNLNLSIPLNRPHYEKLLQYWKLLNSRSTFLQVPFFVSWETPSVFLLFNKALCFENSPKVKVFSLSAKLTPRTRQLFFANY
jgi:hypothetical protein